MSEKLIRDKILLRIQEERLRAGKKPVKFTTVSGTEKQDFFLLKLSEEAKEFIEAKNAEEAGDVLDVLDYILIGGNFDREEVEWRRGEKVRRDWIPDFVTFDEKVKSFRNTQNETNLGDILWIVDRLLEQLGVGLQDVERARAEKKNRNGSFEEGIVIDTEDLKG